MKKVILIDIGTIRYEQGLKVQNMVMSHMKNHDDLAGFLLLVEHDPVFTVGKSGGFENLLWPKEYIKSLGIDIHETNRGGNITYHGLGQIVGYPILNLKHFKKDIHWYMHQLEEIIICTLKENGILAGRKSKYRGVWVADEKICAMGVALKSWITMHGFALNYDINEEHFKLINPCGITDFGITSIKKIKKDVEKEAVLLKIRSNFESLFECKLIEKKFQQLEEMISIDNR
ncbi:lipoyl(octanoyl) transferase [Anaerovirgula multivorans]|uniref:Octanoyltransferase n=1 Tax=Anaerovirgula multivorans TaxID=312168 RepID=A0A239BS31_9FIRM|nr:lipoyl(octanoyl) transferase LipB [Anaerovirgula multivorans]SNS10221.1 lipoyl(octanoyl) transferase [Anaerovirgula multivorans]